jgi:aquaporin Z
MKKILANINTTKVMDHTKMLLAEFLGTFWLVLGGCGSAILALNVPQLGIGYAGVALAFGLSVLTASYAFGHISGGHFNPAVSIGLWAGGRFETKKLPGYIIVQLMGGIFAAALLYSIANGNANTATLESFAANGYYKLSPRGYDIFSVLVIELVLTAFFLIIIMGATSKQAPKGFAPIAIGLALTLIHLISIPVSNTSVNPARSTGVAFFANEAYMEQLWMFWCAPILGAIIGGLIYRFLEKGGK